jgi:hypothetical protein
MEITKDTSMICQRHNPLCKRLCAQNIKTRRLNHDLFMFCALHLGFWVP